MIRPGMLSLPAFLSLRSVRQASWFSCSALLALLGTQLSLVASAQTATFNGAQTAVATAGLSSPLGVAIDSSGTLYIADSANNRVLRETPSNGSYTQSVVAAGLLNPTGVAVDAAGDVYIADTGNNRVIVETLNGGAYSPTVVDSALNAPTGVALDSGGSVYVTDTQNNRVLKETLSGGNYTAAAIGSGFARPEGIVVDASGDVFVVDNGTGRVFKLLPGGSSYTQTVVFAALTSYTGITVDASGDLYLAAASNNNVLKLVPSTCNVLTQSCYTVAIRGTGMSSPWGVAVDGTGDVFVGDSNNNRVLELISAPSVGSVNVGSSSAPVSLLFTFTSSGSIAKPSVLTKGVPNLDFTDAGTGTCTTNGTTYVYATGAVCSVDVTAKPRAPGPRYGAVVLANTSGTPIATGFVSAVGVGPRVGYRPGTMTTLPFTPSNSTAAVATAIDPAGNVFLVESAQAYASGNMLVKLAPGPGGYTPTVIATGFAFPVQVALDGAGNVFVSDQDASTVYEEVANQNGGYTQTTPFGSIGTVLGVAADGAGNVYVSSNALGLVKFTYNGSTYTRSTVDRTGYQEQMVIDASGRILSVVPGQTGYLYTPQSDGTYAKTPMAPSGGYGIALDADGDLYTEEPFRSPLWKYTSADSYTTPIQVLDTGTASNADAVDDAGNVYFAAPGGSLYKLDYADSPSLIFAATPVGNTSSDSPRTVTLANSGNAPLVFELPTSGANPSITANFTLNSASGSDCPLVNSTSFTTASLAAGASCQLPISFSPSGGIPTQGDLSVTDNALNAASPVYATQQIALQGAILQVKPTITWSTPAAISYGTALSSAQLNATTGVAGMFAYTPAAGAVPGPGATTLSVTFTPTDTVAYTSATQSVTLTVNKATPVITWASPAAITYGTPLTATQLNATASVPGTFSYSPATGSVPAAGPQTLSVTFTPADTTNYVTTTGTTSITVNKAPLSLTANNSTRAYGATNPTFTGLVSGAVNGDSLTETFSTVATAASIVGSYPIVPAVTGTNAANYAVTAANGTLSIAQAGSSTALALSNNNLTMTATVTPATSGVPTGTVGFYQGQTQVGSGTLSNGIASYTATTFPAGDVALSAKYLGDTNFAGSASSSILSLAVSASSNSLLVTRGSSVTDNLSVSVVPGYTGTVQFSCSGLPADTTCSFQPASLTFSGTTNTGSVTVTFATDTTASLSGHPFPFEPRSRVTLATILWLPSMLLAASWKRRRKLAARLATLTVMLVFCSVASMLVACSGSGAASSPQTPPGAYTVQVVASGASGLTQNTSVQLSVQ